MYIVMPDGFIVLWCGVSCGIVWCGTWTLLSGDFKRLDVFEVWLWRIERISWTERLSDETVLEMWLRRMERISWTERLSDETVLEMWLRRMERISWTERLTDETVLEMWLRRMERISWTERLTDETVLEMLGKMRTDKCGWKRKDTDKVRRMCLFKQNGGHYCNYG